MTVIAAFCKSKSGKAYLGADDLALPDRNRVDKVLLVYDHFAVACIGSDVAHCAVGALHSFGAKMRLSNGRVFHPARTPEEFTDRIAAVLPAIAARKAEAYDAFRKKSPEEAAKHYAGRAPSSRSTLILMHAAPAPHLFQVVIENVMPPQPVYTLKPEELAPDCWHTWPPNLLAGADLDVRTARKHLATAIGTAKATHGDNFGAPGADVTLVNGTVTYQTCYESLADFVGEDAKRPNVPGVR